ncbi:MAG: ergothioneine biosynthesis protein EgtB [Gammaproteobacteria bacterium]|jgi:ergothioneine biosynthesis protein EgtB
MLELTQNDFPPDQYALPDAYRQTRQATLALCAALETEDYGLQAMPEVSPPRWHLAHTTWFFETFLLKPFAAGYRPFHPAYEYLFNSYYHGVGRQYPRARRGLLSRPTVREVLDYRACVDTAMTELLAGEDPAQRETILARCELGLHHEQQHQELLCTDIKYSFSFNPLYPALGRAPPAVQPAARPLAYTDFAAADTRIGHDGSGFHFDNEAPVHRFHLPAFRLANRLITNAEYLAFMQDGGYTTPGLWLADGWLWREAQAATHPRYWVRQDGGWFEYTLYGLRPLDPDLPVSHVNYYEADACARWYGKRLPAEQEWESACRQAGAGPGRADIALHPRVAGEGDGLQQMFGSLWQWTRSAYAPYPGYRPAAGAIGEYNGKFMCNQLVLRGSSCVTPPGHARVSYRNFFYPADQWQFTGIRLADDF